LVNKGNTFTRLLAARKKETMISKSKLHHTILKAVIDNGYSPDLSILSEVFNTGKEEIKKALQELQEYHGIALHPDQMKIWAIHPFSLSPTNFLVKSNRNEWWGCCAWCSLGIAVLLEEEVDKTKLKDHQKIFVYERLCKYLRDSEFDFDHTPIMELLNSHKKKLEADSIPPQPMTKNIRETLKGLMQKELETLPDTLKELEPIQRLNILCKLMPFVLPRVESIHHTNNEHSDNGFNW